MSRTKPFMLRRIASAGAAAAIVVSGFAAVAASLALTATPAAAANCTSGAGVGGATVTVTPCSGLTNLESVTVTGTGFTPSTAVAVVECVPPVTSTANCDLSTLSFTTATAAGLISFVGAVHESITIAGVPVTCLSSGNCSVLAQTQSAAGVNAPANDETIGFAVAASPSPSPVVSPSPSPTPVVILALSPPAPALPAAGSAGSPGPSGGSVPVEALLLAAVASAVVGALGWRARVYKKSQGT
jgi:Neocarzinostatin family